VALDLRAQALCLVAQSLEIALGGAEVVGQAALPVGVVGQCLGCGGRARVDGLRIAPSASSTRSAAADAARSRASARRR
jgi:hypothetical protein